VLERKPARSASIWRSTLAASARGRRRRRCSDGTLYGARAGCAPGSGSFARRRASLPDRAVRAPPRISARPAARRAHHDEVAPGGAAVALELADELSGRSSLRCRVAQQQQDPVRSRKAPSPLRRERFDVGSFFAVLSTSTHKPRRAIATPLLCRAPRPLSPITPTATAFRRSCSCSRHIRSLVLRSVVIPGCGDASARQRDVLSQRMVRSDRRCAPTGTSQLLICEDMVDAVAPAKRSHRRPRQAGETARAALPAQA